MRLIPIVCASLAVHAGIWGANPDPDPIVRKALSSEILRQRKLENYAWEEKTVEKMFDQKGKLQSTRVKVFDNLIIDGSEYRRLIEEDGNPLSADRAVKEQEKMEREIARRRAESPSQHKARLDERAKRRQEAIKFREEILNAFTFSVVGEEAVRGFDCWKIQAEPKRGFVAQSRQGKMLLGKLHGSMWVTKDGSDLVKVDAETIDKITFGGFLASLGSGSHVGVEMMRVNEELWHPQTIRAGVNARALWKRVNVEEEVSYRNFRKFQTESKMVATDEVR
jgi:hypothetical protein